MAHASTQTSERADIAELGPWFHNLHLPGGTHTCPDHPLGLGDFPRWKWDEIAPHLPADLAGKHALDVGCNAGYYSFALARRGATVDAIDHDPHYLRQARWAQPRLDPHRRVRFHQRGVYSLLHADTGYDLIFFLGVLYHLRYPLLAIDAIAQRLKPGATLVLQTLTMPTPGSPPAPASPGPGSPPGSLAPGTTPTPPLRLGEAAGPRGNPPDSQTPCIAEDYPLDDRSAMARPDFPKLAFIEHRWAGDPTNWFAPNAAAVEAMLRSAGLGNLRRIADETWLATRTPPEDGGHEDHRATAKALLREVIQPPPESPDQFVWRCDRSKCDAA